MREYGVWNDLIQVVKYTEILAELRPMNVRAIILTIVCNCAKIIEAKFNQAFCKLLSIVFAH